MGEPCREVEGLGLRLMRRRLTYPPALPVRFHLEGKARRPPDGPNRYGVIVARPSLSKAPVVLYPSALEPEE